MTRIHDLKGVFAGVIRQALSSRGLRGRRGVHAHRPHTRSVAEAQVEVIDAHQTSNYVVHEIEGKRHLNIDSRRLVAPSFPWDRQRGENARQYEAFTIYRDAGPTRLISDLIGERAISGSANKWASIWSWRRRAEEYDLYMDRRERLLKERNRLERIRRQADLGKRMQAKAGANLDIVEVESVADVVRLAESGVKIERLAMGESTTNEAVGVKFVWGAALPPWAPKTLLEAPNPEPGSDASVREETKEESKS